MPKSIPRLVVDKARLWFLISRANVQRVPNKIHTQELNNILVVVVVVVQMNRCDLCHQQSEFHAQLIPIPKSVW